MRAPRVFDHCSVRHLLVVAGRRGGVVLLEVARVCDVSMNEEYLTVVPWQRLGRSSTPSVANSIMR